MDNKHTSLKDAEKAEKLAEIFIRDNSINIDQNISSGEGKIVNELASALEIKPELRLHFGSLLKKQRVDLMSLANIKNLTPKRAGEFIRFVAQLSENDPELKTSILEFKKKHNI